MKRFLDQARERFAALDEAFRGRTVRERGILAAAAVALIFFGMDSALIQPTSAKLTRIDLQTESATSDINRLGLALAALRRVELTEEERELLKRKQIAEQQLAEINAEIEREISELVPPEAIVSLLGEMLTPDSGLRLVRLESQEPHRVGSGSLHESDTGLLDATASLYRHGLRMEIEGEFADTIEYLKRVESSRWHILWDRFEYRVKQFPEATIIIDLHTVSEQEEWIGV